MKLKKDFSENASKFLNRISRNYEIDFKNKLKNLISVTFKDLFNEIKKKNIKLTPSEEEIEEKYFKEKKEILCNLKNEIQTSENIVNSLIYELYNLTNDEIKIVEDSLNS